MNSYKNILWILVLIFFQSCTKGKGDEKRSDILVNKSAQIKYDESKFTDGLTIAQYQQWSANNTTFIKEKKINEYSYKIKYLPVNLLVLRELKNKLVSKQEVEKIKQEYDGMEYFEMRIQVDNFNDEPTKYNIYNQRDYQTRIAYMAFAMQKDLTLQAASKKEVPCKLFHFERTYGVAPYCTFLMGFSKQDIGNSNIKTLIYNDNLFNEGLIKFDVEKLDLGTLSNINVI